MITWFAITFADNSTGFQKMQDGYCLGVFNADGVLFSPEAQIEYTCTDMNASAPSWA